MRIDKIAITLIVSAFLATFAHQALAQSTAVNNSSSVANNQSTTKVVKKKIVKKTKTVKTVAKKKSATTKSSNTKKKVAKKSAPKPSAEDIEIQKEIRALEMQASQGYTPRTTQLKASTDRQLPADSAMTPASYGESVEIRTKEDLAADTGKSNFSGGVDFGYGNDSNVDPDRINIEARFYLLEPKLSYNNGGLAANAGASIKDFAEQEKSNIYKQNEGKVDIGYTFNFNNTVTSTTTFAALYHDERWPDYAGGVDLNGVDHGMPIRYVDTSITQKFGFDLGMVNLEAGGGYKHRDALSYYTDYAPDFLIEEIYEKDFDELSAFGKATLEAASFLDISLSPSVKQTKFTEREGRLPSGHYSGVLFRAPLYELITSDLALDFNFKLGSSTITPSASVGQISDEALGAEDQNYYSYGIAANIVVYEPLKLTFSPFYSYKEMDYDNWTADSYDGLVVPLYIPNGETRLEDEVSTGITASIMATKNIGFSLSYTMLEEDSNLANDTSEIYKQEIVTSKLVIAF